MNTGIYSLFARYGTVRWCALVSLETKWDTRSTSFRGGRLLERRVGCARACHPSRPFAFTASGSLTIHPLRTRTWPIGPTLVERAQRLLVHTV